MRLATDSGWLVCLARTPSQLHAVLGFVNFVSLRQQTIAPIFYCIRFYHPLKDERILFGECLRGFPCLENCHVPAVGKRTYPENDPLRNEFAAECFMSRVDRHNRFSAGAR